MAIYKDIIEKLDFDHNKYIVVGYFIRKIRDDGLYPDITDVEYFLKQSVYHHDWRRRVIEEKGRKCVICDKEITDSGDLYVIFKGGYKAALKFRNVQTIEQALGIDWLWSTDRGEVRCKDHWKISEKKRGSIAKNVLYCPNKDDADYIKLYVKIDGVEGLAEKFGVPVEAFRKYCSDNNLV